MQVAVEGYVESMGIGNGDKRNKRSDGATRDDSTCKYTKYSEVGKKQRDNHNNMINEKEQVDVRVWKVFRSKGMMPLQARQFLLTRLQRKRFIKVLFRSE